MYETCIQTSIALLVTCKGLCTEHDRGLSLLIAEEANKPNTSARRKVSSTENK